MDESTQVRRILAELEHNPDVNLHRSRIEVSAGDTIRLQGEVEDIATKRRAVQIARRVAKGPVEDALRVRVAQPRESDALRTAVLDALMQEPTFAGFAIRGRGEGAPPAPGQDWIEVEVDGSLVRLHGRVWSLSHRRLAEVLAWWTPGTADVENRIHVEPAERDNDAEITDAVRLVFDKDPSLDAQQIHVVTRAGEVCLQGEVGSEASRRIAAEDCWYIPGVHGVRNELHVRPSGLR